MNEIDTAVLINALVSHPNIPHFNPQKLFDILRDTDEHQSSRGSRFYVELPDTPDLVLTVGVSENEHSLLSLRRILRVNNVNQDYRPNILKVIKGAVLHHYGFFDATDMTRRLRAHPATNFELRGLPWPYAMVGKLVTRANTQEIDEKGIATPLVTRTMPLFILPGAGNSGAITSLEIENAIYRRHDRLIAGFPIPKVITQSEYFALGGTPLKTKLKK